MERPLKCLEELLRQPILWNPLFTFASGEMLGSRTHLAWGKMEHGPAKSIETWRNFCNIEVSEQRRILSTMCGGQLMFEHIQEILQYVDCRFPNSEPSVWVGFFSALGIILGVRGHLTDNTFLSYDVDDDGRLRRVSNDSPVLALATPLKVRIISYDNSVWQIDPPPDAVRQHWSLWAFEKKPLQRLQWDPGGYEWRDPDNMKLYSFFQYSISMFPWEQVIHIMWCSTLNVCIKSCSPLNVAELYNMSNVDMHASS